MKISDVAKLTGVTVRTLHYYDKIGLLKPEKVTDSGYRVYGEAALERLQQILFFRELDFSLSEIGEIMSDPDYDRTEALEKQRTLLIQKRDRLNGLVALAGRALEGEKSMSFKEFDMSEIEEHRKKYAAEAKARWGGTDAYRQSEAKTAGFDEAKWKELSEESGAIFIAFAESRHLSPNDGAVQALVARWQDYIGANFYPCTLEILAGLGEMYVADERFTESLDRYGSGTARFMADAIAAYCKQAEK